MIGIVNYGSGNIHAVANIYQRLNIPHFISKNFHDLSSATHLVLPGVGAFDETMKILNNSGLKIFLDELVLGEQIPVLGICVGMQLLAEGSEEGLLEGFGWIKGTVKKFDPSTLDHKPHLPHMGWNTLKVMKSHNIFSDIDHRQGFYFLHSYYFNCQSENDILGTTEYGVNFASAVTHNNVFGMQFHPEKSHQNGVNLFRNFSKI